MHDLPVARVSGAGTSIRMRSRAFAVGVHRSSATTVTRTEITRQGKCAIMVLELVVVGIIGLLAALVLPVLNRAQAEAQSVHCLTNVRQL